MIVTVENWYNMNIYINVHIYSVGNIDKDDKQLT